MLERWPMTSLLDVFKEADLRIRFTDAFRSATAWENMDREIIQERLLLALYGLGSNAGIKRMNAGQQRTNYKDLLYVRRRYITKDQLRAAIREVVNATLRVRSPEIWGEGTTACASDSKKFGAWDQNLMTEWHVRYGGRGVMIYWHVDRKSMCIYSQLKRCSSSEVAAMIEGVLRHCTDMEVEKQYTDSHGQSEVAFGFCRLHGFELLPRLKAIPTQRLYSPDDSVSYPQLAPVLSRTINWELIAQQYDQMVKYATAMRLGTADTEDILRRFRRTDVKHPVYRAIAELGKATKTIFLCRYLNSMELRRDIHEGLNVIENWNSANDFIFFGKGGEMASNRTDDQEISMLSLHLVQLSLVYVNTLMIQQVLAEPAWKNRLNAHDRRGITPLIYGHVNPYGSFQLDLNSRLPIDPPRFGPQSVGTQLLFHYDQQAG
jgi:TnpA family transposase